jgi:hypothetical protein
MRSLLGLAALVLSACSVTQSPTTDRLQISDDHSQYQQRYEELVELVQGFASQEEFMELREVYVYTKQYSPYMGPERRLLGDMFDAINASDYAVCLSVADEILDFNYISLSAHYGAMICSYAAEYQERGDFHEYVLDGLLDAIWASGDGQSKASAFYCTSTTELQAFIQLHGLTTVDQALVHEDGRSYDLMSVRDPQDEAEFDWYFDITAQWTFGFRGFN